MRVDAWASTLILMSPASMAKNYYARRGKFAIIFMAPYALIQLNLTGIMRQNAKKGKKRPKNGVLIPG